MPSLHKKTRLVTPAQLYAQQERSRITADFALRVYEKIVNDAKAHLEQGNDLKTFRRIYNIKDFVGFFSRTPNISRRSLEEELQKLFVDNADTLTIGERVYNTGKSYGHFGYQRFVPDDSLLVKYKKPPKQAYQPPFPYNYNTFPAYSIYPTMTLYQDSVEHQQLRQFGVPTITYR